jgi:valyl-tRNA synthetase
MEPKFDHQQWEKKIYQLWQSRSAFSPKKSDQPPFSIVLPPPNANASLHLGHAMFVVEDLLIRYHRMLGQPTVWFPGTDHAGIETQFVYEKWLNKQGKSRFDFDRQTLFDNIWQFVEDNRGLILEQLKELGFSLDWSREKYTFSPQVEKLVISVFQKLYRDHLAYRDYRLVNYCTHCGTSFSNLEVIYIDQNDPLYYLKYGPFVLATVRPETKFGDTALAVHPDDRRYQQWIGREIEAQGLIGPFKLKIIADEAVDPQFGTGVVKVTPAHDFTDFEIGQRHRLKIHQVIGFDGRLNYRAGPYAGLTVRQAREKTTQDLQKRGLIVKIDKKYQHRIGVCYRCQRVIEPLPLTQWFVKTSTMVRLAQKAVKTKETVIIPNRYEKIFNQWANNFKDWNISRQIVWGFRIPVWYDADLNPNLTITFLDSQKKVVNGRLDQLRKQYSLGTIKQGLQKIIAPLKANYTVSQTSPGPNFLQDTDTFDTWFSSSLWPLICTGYPKGPDFKNYYPTDVLDTGADILPFWVMRMMIMDKYLTGQSPFRTVYLHSIVVDKHGRKMSKSKGNVINPLELVGQFGADALRMSLLIGSSAGNPISLSAEKVKGYRNFANKIWNIGRFLWLNRPARSRIPDYSPSLPGLTKEDKKIVQDLDQLLTVTDRSLKRYRFSQAGEAIYEFVWHRLADQYLESIKSRLEAKDLAALSTINHVYQTCLKLLHPFMPFVTEAVWQQLSGQQKALLITAAWPTKKSSGKNHAN